LLTREEEEELNEAGMFQMRPGTDRIFGIFLIFSSKVHWGTDKGNETG